MKLEDTIKLMSSKDYNERFIAEYAQTKIRYNALHTILVKKEAGTLEFELTCPVITLKNQQSAMSNYLNQLEIRAELEHIELPII